jgi:hypothetical protein
VLASKMARVVVALAVVVGSAAGPAAADRRVGLVIGIGDYRDSLLGKLDHPQPDANSVAQKLRELGFAVVTVLDPTKPQLQAALDAFVRDYKGADAVFVYIPRAGPLRTSISAPRSTGLACARPGPLDWRRPSRPIGIRSKKTPENMCRLTGR